MQSIYIKKESCLVLVTTRSTTTTSLLEFTSLGSNIWLSRATRLSWSTKVLYSLTRVLGSSHQHSPLAQWRSQCKLVKRQHFTTSLNNSRTCSLRHSQCYNSQLRHLQQPSVVSDAPHNHRNLVLFARHVL